VHLVLTKLNYILTYLKLYAYIFHLFRTTKGVGSLTPHLEWLVKIRYIIEARYFDQNFTDTEHAVRYWDT